MRRSVEQPALAEYGRIPIAFEVSEVYDVAAEAERRAARGWSGAVALREGLVLIQPSEVQLLWLKDLDRVTQAG